MSFPVLNSQGNAIAGLTVPYVKRIEDTVGPVEVVEALRKVSRQISDAMGALTEPVLDEPVQSKKRTASPKK
jgi:DNA-binding IclR family transcriptional regulator